MDLRYIDNITKWSINGWNKQALYCYDQNCVCEGCEVNEILPPYLKDHCQVKNHVLAIYRVCGKPRLAAKKKELKEDV